MISQQTRANLGSVLILLSSGLLGACSSGPTQPFDQPSDRDALKSPVPASSAGQTKKRGIGARAADVATQQIGVPYRYGGQSPTGFDCSGLVHYSYHKAGKSVPRTTAQLWTDVRPVSRSDIEVGDLLFFKIEGKMQHVGMYIGNDRFVHAPSTGKTVNVQSLSSDFYQRAFLRAGRPR